jgi:hypothetical protein
MDARALLLATRLLGVPLPTGLVDHLRQLIERGLLFPSVSSELAQHGQRPALVGATARRHSRSGQWWQVRNQFWALSLFPDASPPTPVTGASRRGPPD